METPPTPFDWGFSFPPPGAYQKKGVNAIFYFKIPAIQTLYKVSIGWGGRFGGERLFIVGEEKGDVRS
jgi:hypothetical protein